MDELQRSEDSLKSISVRSFSVYDVNGVDGGDNCNTLLLTMRNLGGNQVGASYKWLETLYNVQVIGDIVHCTSGWRHCTSGWRHAHIVGKG